MRRCSLLITGDGVAVIQYCCHPSGVPRDGIGRRARGGGEEPANTPSKSATDSSYISSQF